MTHKTALTCTCGQVTLEVHGSPILSVECLCADCQQAGTLLQTLPGAKPTLDHNRATRYEVYRKDRAQCTQGQSRLREHRLTPESKTRRVVANCCNTPMFLEFTQGHWLSVYGGLWPEGTLPALDLRTMTRDRPEGVNLPDNVPNPKTHNVSFMAKLVIAWAAMGFRVPKHDYVHGVLEISQDSS